MGGVYLAVPEGNEQFTFRAFSLASNSGANNIWRINQDQNNQFWISTHQGGLFHMDLPDMVDGNAYQFTQEPTFTAINRWRPGYNGFTSNIITQSIQDHNGNFWVASTEGLNRCDRTFLDSIAEWQPGQVFPEIDFSRYYSNLDQEDGLSNNVINHIFEDRQGNIWISTDVGVNFYNPRIDQFWFSKYNREDQENEYYPFIPVCDSSLWMASADKGLVKFNFWTGQKKYFLPEEYPFINDDRISHVISPDSNQIWLATSVGITFLNPLTQEYKHFPFSEEILNRATYFRASVLEKIEDFLWIGTEFGLFRLHIPTGSYEGYFFDPENPYSISDHSILDVYRDSRKNIWVSTYNGLNRLIGEKDGRLQFERFQIRNLNDSIGLTTNRLTLLRESKDRKLLFIGTDLGLCVYHYDSHTFESIGNIKERFRVQSLEVLPDGQLWGSTSEGIFHYDPDSEKMNTYGKIDGLSEINYLMASSVQTSNGKLYFGSRTGITYVDPELIVENTRAPDTYLTTIRYLTPNKDTIIEAAQLDELKLDHNVYYISIDFAAINYDRPEKNRYAYKLEGFDEDWIYVDEPRSVVYTNLDYGRYIFRVKASNNDGVWNEVGSFVHIVKHPAFWETIWFRSLMILIILVKVGLITLYYTKSVRIQNAQLEAYNQNLNKEISERKRFETALIERERFLRRVMENIPGRVFWLDVDGKVIGGNLVFQKAIGRRHGFIDKPLVDFIDDSAFVEEIQLWIDTVVHKNESIIDQQSQLTFGMEEGGWVLRNVVPLRNLRNRIIGILVTEEDITARFTAEKLLKSYSIKLEGMVEERTAELASKNREIETLLSSIQSRNEELEQIVAKRTQTLRESNQELERSNNDLEQFAFAASHDLQEPLRIVGTFARLLSKRYKDKLDERAFDYINFIDDGVDRMSKLITSLLTYSRVGRKEMEVQKSCVKDIVESKMKDLYQLIRERNVSLEIYDMPEIWCEPNQIGIVFYNLINNGIKFNTKEHPIIRIRAEESDQDTWIFSVSDNGIGIDEKYQSKIFEVFRRLHTREEYEGTGIGLSLCQKIINRHGGKIWVESKVDEGTTFYFSIKSQKKESIDLSEPMILNGN